MKRECGNCRYFDVVGEQAFGACRRRAPSPCRDDENLYPTAYWPEVASEEWCGEWGARVEYRGELAEVLDE